MSQSQNGFRISLVIGMLLLGIYSGAYLSLSRRGYAQADQCGIKGFYYFQPEDSDTWRMKNTACIHLFHPINLLDRPLGTGRHPAAEPLRGRSMAENSL